MRKLIIITAGFFEATLSFGQASKEKAFVATLTHIVTALANRDSATLSKYIDKNTGVYILSRPGIMDSYSHYPRIGFSDTTYPNVPFYDKVRLTKLKYAKLPTFDCEKWTKTGTFVDTTIIDHLLSKIAKNLNKEIKGAVPSTKINTYYKLENKSRRVVIADNDGGELIIYLSFINNKWALTIIDKVTCDCST